MSERIFVTQGEVWAFLRSLGLKVGRTKISTDFHSGRLKCTSDKQFREDDVLAYAESLKAPAVQEKADREQKLRTQRDQLKALLASLLRALPDNQAVASALEKWLNAQDEEGNSLCAVMRDALNRIREKERPLPATPEAPLPSAPPEPEAREEEKREDAAMPARELPELVYRVRGSSPTPYTVRFQGEGPGLTARCSCPAGTRAKTFCKHVAALLKGDRSCLADDTTDLAPLRSRAEGSPLLDKAGSYTVKMRSRRILVPVPSASADGIKGLQHHINSRLEGTQIWSDYSSKEDGSEYLAIFIQEFRKDGAPRKRPTLLLSLAYEPIRYENQWVGDEDSGGWEYKAAGRRALPYQVNSTHYRTLDSAWTVFAQKLDALLPDYKENNSLPE